MCINCFHKTGSKKVKFPKISEHIMFETIMSYSQDSIYFKDRGSRFIYNNKRRAMKHGVKDMSGMIGKTDFDFFYRNNAKESMDAEQEILKTGQPVLGKIEKLVRLDGTTTWSSTSKYPLYDKKGRIIGTWGVSRDITEYEKAKEALRLSEAKQKAMIENISDVIAIKDSAGIITYLSLNIKGLFGWDPSEIIGHDICGLILPLPPEENLKDKLAPAEDGAMTVTECICRHKDGSERVIRLTAVNLINNSDIHGVLINFHDITESKRRENKILYLSYHDTLTGLYNRAFFDEEKARLDTGRQLPISIIMGDVNGLKLTNDAFGHNEGDKLLMAIAQILKASCRKEDIIARTGGDEFCILLPQTTGDIAQSICERIKNLCKDYNIKTPNGLAIQPSISLGYATKTTESKHIDSIQKDAEDFMYKRKLLEHKSTHGSIISSIKATMNETSQETEEHSERMIKLSRALGHEMNLSEQELVDLDLLSTLHDVGKICIHEKILSKPGKLSDEEWIEIKKHPEMGCRIAQSSSELMRIAQYILYHHERWDGGGYPSGIAGEDIPLLSRIIAVVDAYDAMTQNRPYRKALSKEIAVSEIVLNSGTQFDPAIARIFVEKVLGRPWGRFSGTT